LSAVLVIAGTDSSGGAGLTRDAAALAHFKVGVLCAVTAVTAQTDAAVLRIERVPAAAVAAQIAAALASGRVAAVKTGMLGGAEVVEAVAQSLPPGLPLIVDPVLAATSGGALLDRAGRTALIERLLPRTRLLTPNLAEAAQLLGTHIAATEEEMIAQAEALCARGPAAVLIKADGSRRSYSAARSSVQLRGTGCALASAIAAGIATGLDLPTACARAKTYVTDLLQQTR